MLALEAGPAASVRSGGARNLADDGPPGVDPPGESKAMASVRERVRRLLPAGRSAMWGISDQFLYAVSNSALTFVAANILVPNEFGTFALLYTAVVILIGVARALTTEPFTVLTGDLPLEERLPSVRSCLGLCLTLGAASALVLVVVGAVAGSATTIMFGFVTLPVMAQDSVRYTLVSLGRPRAAFVNDLIWLLVQASATVAALLVGVRSAASLAGWWGLGAAAAVAVGIVQLGVTPALREALAWWRRTRTQSIYFALEFLALAGSGYSIVYFVALTSSLADAGAYRGAQAIFGPLTSLTAGLRMVALPAVVRMRPRGRAAILRAVAGVAVSMLAIGMVATALLFVLRGWIGPLLLGATAATAITLIIPMGIGRALSSAGAGPLLGMRAMGAAKRSLGTRVALSLLTVGAAVTGSVVAGAAGAAWGFAGASAVGLIVWSWIVARQQLVLRPLEQESG